MKKAISDKSSSEISSSHPLALRAALSLSLVACGGNNGKDFDTPEELSVFYTDLAENLIEKLGYQIKEIIEKEN